MTTSTAGAHISFAQISSNLKQTVLNSGKNSAWAREKNVNIELSSLLHGAQHAEGVVIVIDVFRAFTTAAVAFAQGVEKIILVAEVEEALALRNQGKGQLCVGEVGGRKPEGFDFGNSPYELSQAAGLSGQTLIQSTRAGTVGVAAAQKAETLYLGSFVIATATVKAVLAQTPVLVSIVAMGAEARQRTDEDEQCALYLRNLFQGRRPNPDAVSHLVRMGQEAQKYDDPALPHFHPEDKALALQIDKYDFALRVRREDGLLVARKDTGTPRVRSEP
jgi:2-phosphosulfolactate phosphatase